ncbi:uncharacterized protein LOC108675554 [Hyalella azteca]|uniref:Uncharacterized protein LOC108675554 n=1 Tax=Hyalella azteca TaxID=294128 RepID=A0A8B7NZ91_HYAAZ|nr:uncharacterized protein LOC108675554 [Hyalella azteca]
MQQTVLMADQGKFYTLPQSEPMQLTVNTSPKTSNSQMNCISQKVPVVQPGGTKVKSKIQCLICSKTFHTSHQFEIHYRNHTGEKPFKCKECDAQFTGKNRLVLHIRKHTGERPYMCGICHQKFQQTAHLKVHMKKHSAEKPYKCSQCSKCFKHCQSLKIHILEHSDNWEFKCQECDKLFTTSLKLKKHSKVHSGGKLFQCNKCNKQFRDAAYVAKHQSMFCGNDGYKKRWKNNRIICKSKKRACTVPTENGEDGVCKAPRSRGRPLGSRNRRNRRRKAKIAVASESDVEFEDLLKESKDVVASNNSIAHESADKVFNTNKDPPFSLDEIISNNDDNDSSIGYIDLSFKSIQNSLNFKHNEVNIVTDSIQSQRKYHDKPDTIKLSIAVKKSEIASTSKGTHKQALNSQIISSQLPISHSSSTTVEEKASTAVYATSCSTSVVNVISTSSLESVGGSRAIAAHEMESMSLLHPVNNRYGAETRSAVHNTAISHRLSQGTSRLCNAEQASNSAVQQQIKFSPLQRTQQQQQSLNMIDQPLQNDDKSQELRGVFPQSMPQPDQQQELTLHPSKSSPQQRALQQLQSHHTVRLQQHQQQSHHQQQPQHPQHEMLIQSHHNHADHLLQNLPQSLAVSSNGLVGLHKSVPSLSGPQCQHKSQSSAQLQPMVQMTDNMFEDHSGSGNLNQANFANSYPVLPTSSHGHIDSNSLMNYSYSDNVKDFFNLSVLAASYDPNLPVDLQDSAQNLPISLDLSVHNNLQNLTQNPQNLSITHNVNNLHHSMSAVAESIGGAPQNVTIPQSYDVPQSLGVVTNTLRPPPPFSSHSHTDASMPHDLSLIHQNAFAQNLSNESDNNSVQNYSRLNATSMMPQNLNNFGIPQNLCSLQNSSPMIQNISSIPSNSQKFNLNSLPQNLSTMSDTLAPLALNIPLLQHDSMPQNLTAQRLSSLSHNSSNFPLYLPQSIPQNLSLQNDFAESYSSNSNNLMLSATAHDLSTPQNLSNHTNINHVPGTAQLTDDLLQPQNLSQSHSSQPENLSLPQNLSLQSSDKKNSCMSQPQNLCVTSNAMASNILHKGISLPSVACQVASINQNSFQGQSSILSSVDGVDRSISSEDIRNSGSLHGRLDGLPMNLNTPIPSILSNPYSAHLNSSGNNNQFSMQQSLSIQASYNNIDMGLTCSMSEDHSQKFGVPQNLSHPGKLKQYIEDLSCHSKLNSTPDNIPQNLSIDAQPHNLA